MKNKKYLVILLMLVLILGSFIFKFYASKISETKKEGTLEVKSSKTVEMKTTSKSVEETTKEKVIEETTTKPLSPAKELFNEKPDGVLLDGEEVFYEEDSFLNDYYKKQLEWMGACDDGEI